MSSKSPLVSVICLCHNHQDYVVEAITSVFNQTYNAIELIVIDDASSDASVEAIKSVQGRKEQFKFVALDENIGNCKAFNIGWSMASGAYFIDLAADDFLLPDRIERGVTMLEEKGQDYGVHYCDAQLIDHEGKLLKEHRSSDYYHGTALEGLIFEQLLSKYFINPVTMMFSAEVLERLGGYDETLAYEDFDFWVRSSKYFKYCYSAEVLVVKRVLQDSHGRGQYQFRSSILDSTYSVCLKAFDLCDTKAEYGALAIRIFYELKRAIFSFNWRTAANLYALRTKVVRKLTT